MPTTFVDDAEFIWRELDEENPNKKTQEQVAEILQWSRGKVSQYAMLRSIGVAAWEVIATTFEQPVALNGDEDVAQLATSVAFTEGLLRSILDLRAPQQLDLVSRLATDKTFNKLCDFFEQNESAFVLLADCAIDFRS